MQWFLKIPSGIANSVDPDQTAPVFIGHFVRNFGEQNVRTFSIIKSFPILLAHLCFTIQI